MVPYAKMPNFDAPNASNAFGVAAPLGALRASDARNYARKRSNAPNAPTPEVQKSELSTLQRVTLSHDSQSAWSLTRHHQQRVVTLAQKHTADIFLYSGGGNSNIVTPLNVFMETFLARNVHFTFIMFAQ